MSSGSVQNIGCGHDGTVLLRKACIDITRLRSTLGLRKTKSAARILGTQLF
jgi:hypothetical protein